MSNEDWDDEELWSGRPNKSEIKRKMAEYHDAATALLNYKAKELQAIDLTEDVVAAILEAQKMPLKNGRKRHVKFIAKQLRFHEINDIRDMIQTMDDIRDGKIKTPTVPVEESPVELWIKRLISDGDEVQNELLESCPTISRQALRTAVRNLCNSKDEKKRNAYLKNLEKLLRDAL